MDLINTINAKSFMITLIRIIYKNRYQRLLATLITVLFFNKRGRFSVTSQGTMYLLFAVTISVIIISGIVIQKYKHGDKSLKKLGIIFASVSLVMIIVSCGFGSSVHAKNVKYKNAMNKFDKSKKELIKDETNFEDFDQDYDYAHGDNTFTFCIKQMKANNTGRYHNYDKYYRDYLDGKDGMWRY